MKGEAGATHRSSFWVGLGVMGIFYVAAGVNHFWHPVTYLAVMPPYIPRPEAMVQISGLAEILGGLGVFFPRIRKLAAWGLVGLLIAIWPVHFNMCLHPEAFPGIPLWAIWLRMPLQIPLIAWAWFYTRF